jgi:hypothetical protein
MLKSFFLPILLLVVSTLLITATTFTRFLPAGTLVAAAIPSSPLPQETRSLAPANAKAARSDHQFQTNEADKAELNRSREKAPEVSASPSPPPPPSSPYDMEAIQKFNRQLYGAGN